MKILENKEKNGIELYFEAKPEQHVIDVLKVNKWRWHNQKKCWYTIATVEARKVADLLSNGADVEVAEPTEKQTKDGVKIGDIFVSSWGYEQTNVDFYQVVDIKGTSTVILRAVGGEFTGYTSGMAGERKPVKDSFTSDELIIKRVVDGVIKFSHSNAYLWDGKRSYYNSWYY